jgi:UDP-N-acetylglucosamine--N-acetylmuramyl-(pentapeptide) pyrophosphoryl-undecaprenol N-acetylglucosamine transferase
MTTARDASTALRFLIAGGGTGGHVTPALALAEELSSHGDEVLFLGSERGLEKRLVPTAGFELITLPARQYVGLSVWGRIRALLGLATTVPAAWRVLARFRPHLVISVGGYAAAPAVVASILSRRALVLVEPNALPGRVHRATARFAGRVFVAPGPAAGRLASARGRVRALGTPLRRSLREAFAAAPARRRPSPPYRLLVFGGSQGAHQLNTALTGALPHLADLELDVFHQTGEADRDSVAEAYSEAGVRAQVAAFESDMPGRYRWADLALCRAGALTVAELAMAGLPALLVPLKTAADDHQTENARALEAAGAGWLLDPGRLDSKTLAERLRAAFADPDGLAGMSEAASRLARPHAAREISAECRSLAMKKA